jgi:hypothetical protein
VPHGGLRVLTADTPLRIGYFEKRSYSGTGSREYSRLIYHDAPPVAKRKLELIARDSMQQTNCKEELPEKTISPENKLKLSRHSKFYFKPLEPI